MKLALYLPNLRDKITVSEIVDLAREAEALEFDSVWSLDRIVVPEASDRQALGKSFGFMSEFPKKVFFNSYFPSSPSAACAGYWPSTP
ncbi:MAG: LLM class flavin-dependent oxidoreductase [Deltaproteobacteria bacterium]|nr:LLM class flavin-dependent oxidoreductase [Deltaproteobacteria bacterium]